MARSAPRSRLAAAVPPATFGADAVYTDFGSAHNVAINEDTGFAYVVGSDTCGEGLHMIDVSVPVNPLFAGCHSAFEVHDTVCTIYQGPDAAYTDSEICFSSAKVSLLRAYSKNRASFLTLR